MLGLTGVLLISAALVLSGFYVANIVKIRCIILEECIYMIRSVSSQIDYTDEPVQKILQNIVKGNNFRYLTFLKTMSETDLECGFDTEWCKYIKTDCNGLAFEKQTVSLLEGFGQKLGKTNSSGQKELCNYYERKFEQLYLETNNRKNEKMKLCRIVGIAAGAIVFIFSV